jgi:hypothetical protein
MGRHANHLNGMTSWPLAATLALGRNTGLAGLKTAARIDGFRAGNIAAVS